MPHLFARLRGALLSVALLITGHAWADVIDGPRPFVDLFGDAHVDVVNGADVSFLHLWDTSSAHVRGGAVGWLMLHEDSFAHVSGGELSWVIAGAHSAVWLSGLDSLSWLKLESPDSRATIFAKEASYARGHLFGRWHDGRSFDFWALGPGPWAPDVMPANITLITAVPEPGSVWLTGVGLALLAFARRKYFTR